MSQDEDQPTNPSPFKKLTGFSIQAGNGGYIQATPMPSINLQEFVEKYGEEAGAVLASPQQQAPQADVTVPYTIAFHTSEENYNKIKVDVENNHIDSFIAPGFIPRLTELVEVNDDGTYTMSLNPQAVVHMSKALRTADEDGFIASRMLGQEFAALLFPANKSYRDTEIGYRSCKWHLPAGEKGQEYKVISATEDDRIPDDYAWANMPFGMVACTNPTIIGDQPVGHCNVMPNQLNCVGYSPDVGHEVEVTLSESKVKGRIFRTINPAEATTQLEVFTEDFSRVSEPDYTIIESEDEESADDGTAEERVSPLRLVGS